MTTLGSWTLRGPIKKVARASAKALMWGFCVIAFSSGSFIREARAEQISSKELRDRLNKIFYWHLSDELKLSQKQERDVVAALESLQLKREEALKTREDALGALRKLPKDAGIQKTRPYLDKYLQSLETLASLDREEYTALKNAMGEELLGRFYIIREDVTTRVRKALRN
jgi:hypothetical protein